MRVLHVVTTGTRRGAEVFASDLIAALATLPQHVAILHGTHPSDVQFAAPITFLHANGGLPGIRLDISALRALARLSDQWRPDVIQAHGGETLKYCALLPRGRRRRIAYRRIGTAPPWLLRGARRRVYSRLMRASGRVVAVAEAVRRETLEVFRIPGEQVLTIPNGVDLQRLGTNATREEVRRRLGVPPEATVVLSFGGLTWEKNPLAHLNVAQRVCRKNPDVVHAFLGDGPMRIQVEDEILRRGLSGRVLLLGQRDRIGEVLHAVDLVLFASRPDGMEGMPASVIEAGLSGLPVVAFAVAGVPEVVVNERTGILVPHGAVEQLAESVCRLVEDPERRRQMGRAAMAWCGQFEIPTVARRYLDLYEELAG